jgi:hypothetical protein
VRRVRLWFQEGNIHVLQEQGARRCDDADAGRRRPKNRHPTDTPRPQVFVQNPTEFSHGPGDPIGFVQDNQLWGADWGVLR